MIAGTQQAMGPCGGGVMGVPAHVLLPRGLQDCPLLQSLSLSWVGLGVMLSDLSFVLVQNSEPSKETLLLILTSFLAST